MSDARSFPQAYGGAHGLNLSDVPLPPLPAFRVPLGPPVAPHRDDIAHTQPEARGNSAAPSREVLAAHFVRKSYRKGPLTIPVLQGIELAVHESEFVSIVGPSGCGKTTLLHLLATLDRPDAGEICFEGNRIDNLPTAGRDILRNRYFGMVFQFYHLLPELSVLENVLMPAMIGQGIFGYLANRRANRERAREILEMVGLGHRMKHKPRELSGGEMQRTAIARAPVCAPRFCWPTSRPATSTSTRAKKSWRFCVG